MRAQDDPEFAAFLLKLGNGQLQQSDCSHIELPDFIQTININTDAPIEDLLATLIPF